MKIRVIVHEAEEGGYWAEVPAIPGCETEGDTWDELLANLHEEIEGCLSIDDPHILSLLTVELHLESKVVIMFMDRKTISREFLFPSIAIETHK